jgi:hypothetical protein
MPIQFTNNATSLTAFPALAGDTTVTIEAGDVWMFPPASASAGTYFYATIEDRRIVPTRREIVKVIDRSGAVFTVVRGQDSTAAHDFFTGAIFSHRLNAAALRALIQEEADARIAADNAEAAARIAADNNLQTQITAEVNARIAGDANLQTQINNEVARAEAAEAALQAQMLGFASAADLTAEKNRALAAEAALGVRIDNETAARIAADNHLQAEIDAEIARAEAAEAALAASISGAAPVTWEIYTKEQQTTSLIVHVPAGRTKVRLTVNAFPGSYVFGSDTAFASGTLERDGVLLAVLGYDPGTTTWTFPAPPAFPYGVFDNCGTGDHTYVVNYFVHPLVAAAYPPGTWLGAYSINATCYILAELA